MNQKTLLLLGLGLDAPDTINILHELGLKIVFVQKENLFNKDTAILAQEIILFDFSSKDFYAIADKLNPNSVKYT